MNLERAYYVRIEIVNRLLRNAIIGRDEVVWIAPLPKIAHMLRQFLTVIFAHVRISTALLSTIFSEIPDRDLVAID